MHVKNFKLIKLYLIISQQIKYILKLSFANHVIFNMENLWQIMHTLLTLRKNYLR